MTRVFSGMQPSGGLHLGNYLGALVNWVDMQADRDCVYCIVDLHAVTTEHDPADLRDRTVRMATEFLAAGVDPDDSILFVQSHVPEHTECTWLLNCVTGVGELQRMPQFREKSERASARGEFVSAGLLDYPVLQTADIILYHADEVPVGEDQAHHIELARDIAGRFNHRFGEVFTLPEPIHPPAAARVMDLQSPGDKMSKSASSEKGIVHLLDDPDTIAAKVRSAVTDSGREIRHDPTGKAGISNLLEIMAALTDRDVADLEQDFADSGYGDFKAAVAEATVEALRPIRERHERLADDPGEVERILADGATRAREIAADTLARAREAMGFLAPAAP